MKKKLSEAEQAIVDHVKKGIERIMADIHRIQGEHKIALEWMKSLRDLARYN